MASQVVQSLAEAHNPVRDNKYKRCASAIDRQLFSCGQVNEFRLFPVLQYLTERDQHEISRVTQNWYGREDWEDKRAHQRLRVNL